MIKLLKYLVIFSTLNILISCNSYVKPNSDNNAKIKPNVQINLFGKTRIFSISHIDNKILVMAAPPFELTPENHTIRVYVKFHNGPLTGGEHIATGELQLKATANKLYQVNGDITGAGGLLNSDYTAELWIEDTSNGKIASNKIKIKAGADVSTTTICTKTGCF
jgi:hypothetical protein